MSERKFASTLIRDSEDKLGLTPEQVSQLLADANKSAAITDKFGTETNGGLITTVMMLLREANSATVTAGISGLQGTNKDEVAIWAGGTDVEAIRFKDLLSAFRNNTTFPTEKIANFLVNHDGAVKIGKFVIDDRGVIHILDPVTKKSFFQASDEPIPSYYEIASSVADSRTATNSSRTYALPSSDGTVSLTNTLTVPKGGGDLTFTGTVSISVSLPINTSVKWSIELYKGGYYATIDSGSKVFKLAGGDPSTPPMSYSYSSPLSIKFENVPKGTYQMRMKGMASNSISNPSLVLSATSMKWDFGVEPPERIQVGSNGFYGWFGANRLYYSKEEGVIINGAVNIPTPPSPYVGGASFYADGGTFRLFGDFTPNCSKTGTGTYLITHYLTGQFLPMSMTNTQGTVSNITNLTSTTFTVRTQNLNGVATDADFSITIHK